MDIIFELLGLLFVFLGILGSFLPVLPGPLTGWVGLFYYTKVTEFLKTFL